MTPFSDPGALMQKKYVKLIAALAVVMAGGSAYLLTRPSVWDTATPLVARTGPVDLLADLDPDAPSDGWKERRFFRITPTTYQLTQEDDRTALRCTTDNAASILARDTDIALAALPILSWSWKLTQPIDSDIDETTRDGDDHALRFYLRFINETGTETGTEIIWSNKSYAAGDYKIIDGFYHLVATGHDAPLNTWQDNRVDLRQVYRDIGGTGSPTLDVFGFFCDSDNTGSRSDGFFADISLSAG
ncbi:DUF3047 domain-containing protein [Tritonibacter litoralis]|nr:DUF3047 domain-containing protein [Tritonibacter litoralis]